MAKRISSEIKQEYKKEIQRIQRVISKVEKEGYIFPEDVVPKLPKRVTKKALEEVKAIKASDLYKVGEFVGKKSTTIPEPKKETRARKTEVKPPRTKTKTSQVKVHTPRIAKEKPEPLTAEQKAKNRSEAGKKAWETRKAKMTPEQYQDYVKQQVERMQKGRKAKQKGEQYYPTKSAIEEVTNKVVQLERGWNQLSDEEAKQIEGMFKQEYYPTIERYDTEFNNIEYQPYNRNVEEITRQVWYGYKADLLSVWHNTLDRHKNTMQELEDYLIQNMDEIDYKLLVVQYDSNLEAVRQSFVRLAVILNQSALTAEEAENMHNMSEQYSFDNTDDFAE